jgi:CHAT domain-containing protein
MVEFYKKLLAGLPKSESLREAQLIIKKKTASILLGRLYLSRRYKTDHIVILDLEASREL